MTPQVKLSHRYVDVSLEGADVELHMPMIPRMYLAMVPSNLLVLPTGGLNIYQGGNVGQCQTRVTMTCCLV